MADDRRAQIEQWPSAGRVIHVQDGQGGCRGGSIVRVIGEPGPEADVELFVYPSNEFDRMGETRLDPPFSGRAAVHRDEWHWPEYVGPLAKP